MAYGTFHDYAALGITRRGTEDGRVVRTISMAGFSGFGELKTNAPNITDYYGRTDDKWDQWMNAAGQTWARVTGNVDEAIRFRNRGVQLNGAFGKGWLESCGTIFTPLPDDPNNCDDIPCVGLICRGLPAHFHPCESVVRAGLLRAAEKCGKSAADFVQDFTGGNSGQQQQQQATISLDVGRVDARGQSDTDLRKQLDVFGGVAPDPNSNPDGAIFYAAYVEEFNFRAQNLCPGLGYRDYRFGMGSDGRPNCGGNRRRAGRPPVVITPPFSQKQLEDLVKRNTPGGGAAAPNTALIAGGIAVAVAAIFLLKK